ncbi:ArsR/SmtB family transcription factor [Halopiger goleimassiliensis]|uniref:ArsR/SmtB family transcription factor n=1 Tax=Halopiger goleimassiliensis TaxID=1293048 RepID=UPI000677EE90|nr:winged helix-turn-helix transcriptional regulator [Halopiger goleimassiliensis]
MGEEIRSDSADDGHRTPREKSPTASGTAPTTAERVDGAFSLLTDARRRRVLYALVALEDPVTDRSTVAVLANVLGVAPPDEPTPTISEPDLHHDHLPTLEEAGVVEYDPRQGTVRYVGVPFDEELIEHAYYTETGQLLSGP